MEDKEYEEENFFLDSFDIFWKEFGISFTNDVFEFIKRNGGLSKYFSLNDTSNEKSSKIGHLIIDYLKSLINLEKCNDSIISIFQEAFGDSLESDNLFQLYSEFCWGIYYYIQSRYKDIPDPFFPDNQLILKLVKDQSLRNEMSSKNKRHLQFSSNQKCQSKKNKCKKNNSSNIFKIAQLKKEGLEKFWYKRYQLFSKFDQGIKLDKESWYSVTPEELAIHHAQYCASPLAVDPFCGSGGNLIQLSMTCGFVIGGDMDIEKIKLAKHNGKIYKIKRNVDFIVADGLYTLNCIRADSCLLSPPWGGISYISLTKFSISKHMMPNINKIFEHILSDCKKIALFIPRNSTLKPIKRAVKKYFNNYFTLEKNYFNNILKTITVYIDNVK